MERLYFFYLNYNQIFVELVLEIWFFRGDLDGFLINLQVFFFLDILVWFFVYFFYIYIGYLIFR